ncbi:MAG: Na+/H+ antiporter NhaA type [uncultured Acidimicrobiales bacterium]|uniref:Na(+)/H(+) antiporter NhaA n=1 Tax=uncultured Acidimicrobiales bacterium TaxID=310071 RepID=A0A6J4J953_9ACTN|nr:MAG: Na+/H+ antiporter NhaA type [uncultured Acidimicrobiales bacterium]
MSTQTDQPQGVDALPGRRLPKSVREFLETEASGGILLLAAALIALVWANSPWSASYQSLWHTDVRLNFGRYVLQGDLHHWVNDALMVVFFFVVGLEIKRELVEGKLRDPRTAAMPAIAALGGMVVPAALYILVTAGGEGSRGWGIPMATDIAFAVGVVALLGRRVPASLKLFLLTLAIVDDIGAIIVIGAFYSTDIQPQFFGAAAALIIVILLLSRSGVVWLAPYVVLGAALWLVTYASGVHATIAGVVLGLLTPARNMVPSSVARQWAADLDDEPTADELDAMTRLARHSQSPAERIAHVLHPWSSFLIVPIFALANAGVQIKSDSFDGPGAAAVTGGVMLGLVAGKTLGITGAAWLATRLGIARLPEGANWGMMAAIACIAGIGFTVSLFVAELAFEGGALQDAAKVGVLAASLMAAILGAIGLRRACRPEAGVEA